MHNIVVERKFSEKHWKYPIFHISNISSERYSELIYDYRYMHLKIAWHFKTYIDTNSSIDFEKLGLGTLRKFSAFARMPIWLPQTKAFQ